jgi:hypothetical protein
MNKKNGPHDHDKPSEKRSISGEVKVHGGIQVFEAESAVQKHDAEREKDNAYKHATQTHENASLLISRITLFVTTLYFAVTCLIFYQSKRSADAAKSAAETANATLNQARQQFLLEQRPILWLTNDLGIPEFILTRPDIGTGQIVWNWHFTNYGKTPPQNLRIGQFMKVGDETFKPSCGAKGPSYGAPTPPGKIDFSTTVSEPGITRKTFDGLIERDGGISISMKLIYSDAYGEDYEAGICLSRLRSGAIEYCPGGNYIK